jgi:hypothetical protein
MRFLLVFAMLLFGSHIYGQPVLNDWIDKIKSVIISAENIEPYSLYMVSADIKVDFVFVEDLVLTYQDTSIFRFRMVGPNNTETGCLEFQYVRCKEKFYLQFGDVREIDVLGNTRKFISPWIEKYDACPPR